MRIEALVCGVAALLWCGAAFGGEATGTALEPDLKKVTYEIDFADLEADEIEDWLEQKGFELEQEADDPDKITLGRAGDALLIEAREPAFGLIVTEDLAVERYSTVRLEWGVKDFPSHASYENEVKNEAIMVYFTFGEETHSSGSFFVPDLPYFIGLFLCTGEDRVGHGYVGRYHQKSGRYVCVDRPREGETVTTEFDLKNAFKTFYGVDQVPAITGIGLSVDTSEADEGGASSAFVKAIQFLE